VEHTKQWDPKTGKQVYDRVKPSQTYKFEGPSRAARPEYTSTYKSPHAITQMSYAEPAREYSSYGGNTYSVISLLSDVTDLVGIKGPSQWEWFGETFVVDNCWYDRIMVAAAAEIEKLLQYLD
jgi:hypothetical protein